MKRVVAWKAHPCVGVGGFLEGVYAGFGMSATRFVLLDIKYYSAEIRMSITTMFGFQSKFV